MDSLCGWDMSNENNVSQNIKYHVYAFSPVHLAFRVCRFPSCVLSTVTYIYPYA